MTRPPATVPRRSAQAPSASRRLWPVVASAAAILTLLWLVWPSGASGVKNLSSSGTAVVALGDSLTAGFGAAAGEDYPSRLSSALGVTVVNAGVSGDTTAGALARLNSDVVVLAPRIVIVGLGGNDFLRGVPIASSEENLRMIVREVQKAGAMVVLLGFRFPGFTANYETMYERVAKDEGALLVPDLLDGILSDPKLRSDEIHPNAAGYALMAERIAPPLRKLLKKADAAR